MDSKMTQAFKTKAKRSLGCRPGYEGGGTTAVYRSGNSFGDASAMGGGASQVSFGNIGTASAPAATPVGGGRGVAGDDTVSMGPMRSQGSLPASAFNDTAQGRIAFDKHRYLQNGVSEATYNSTYSPDAVRDRDAARKVQDKLSSATFAEKDMLAGHNPNGRYSVDPDGNKMFHNQTPELQNSMRAKGMASLGFAGNSSIAPNATLDMQSAIQKQAAQQLGQRGYDRLFGYADGGAVVKEDPVEALLRRTSQNYGVAAPAPQPVPQPRPAPQPAPQPEQKRGLGDIVRERMDKLKQVSNYANGGEVEQFEFQGPGGPREDKIPVRFAGADIRVSDGERGLILPAKTAQNPHAVDAIEDIIQTTNDGREPRRGLAQGGHYANGVLDYFKNFGNPTGGAAPVEPVTAPVQPAPVEPVTAPVQAAQRVIPRSVRGVGQTPVPPVIDATNIGSRAAPVPPAANIAPELVVPETPAPVAEASARRGLSGRVIDALKGGAQKVAGKALGMEPKASTAPAVPTAPATPAVENPIPEQKISASRALNARATAPIDTRAAVETAKNVAHSVSNIPAKVLGTGLDVMGKVGPWLAPVAAISDMARDQSGTGIMQGAADIAMGMGGRFGGGLLVPADIATRITNDGRGVVQTMADRFSGKYVPETAQRGTDQILSAVRGTGFARALGLDTPELPQSKKEFKQTVPQDLQARLADRAEVLGIDNALVALTPADYQRQRELGAHTGNAGQVGYEEGGNGMRWNAGRNYDPTTKVFAPGTGVATVTGEAENGGRNMPGIKRNALGTSIFIGPGSYTAKDGSETADWSKTAAFEDAQRRAQQNRIDLQQIQDERRGTSSMASRALGQTMQAPGVNAQSGGTTSDEVMAQALRNMASVDPGTRALGHQQLAAQNQMITQQMAIARMNREALNQQTEQGVAGNDSVIRQSKELEERLKLDPAFQKQEGDKTVHDPQKVGEYMRLLNTTVANAHNEAPADQKYLWESKVTKKARAPGELDTPQHAELRKLFDIKNRIDSQAGMWYGQGEKLKSDDLRDYEPVIHPDGTIELPRLTKRMNNGKKFIVKSSSLDYADGAYHPLNPAQLFATRTTSYAPTEVK